MKFNFKILIILTLFPFTFFAQEKDSECVEYESIEIYNLRKLIIDKQKLDVWPDLVEIKEIKNNNGKVIDSLILFIAEIWKKQPEINGEMRLRISKTSDLTKFSEMDYDRNCKQDGTILTDLKIGMIDKLTGEIEILCRQDYYGKLKIKN